MITPTEPSINGEDDRPVRESRSDPLRAEIAALRQEVQALRREIADPEVRKFLSVAEVSETLSLSERTVRSYISSNELRSVTFGRRRVVPVDALREFVEERLDSS